MKTYNAKPISTTKYLLGESPFYDERNGQCSFVDIKAGYIPFWEKTNLTQTI